MGLEGLECRAWGLGLVGGQGLGFGAGGGFRVWGLGLVGGLGFGVWGWWGV